MQRAAQRAAAQSAPVDVTTRAVNVEPFIYLQLLQAGGVLALLAFTVFAVAASSAIGQASCWRLVR